MKKGKKGFYSRLKSTFLFLFFFFVIGFSGIAIYNSTLPTDSPHKSQLSEAEYIRLNEITNLRTELGSEIWPGWEKQETPILIYNEDFAFLVGIENPDPGWIRVPYKTLEGGPWERVETDSYHYFRQQLPASGETPQAFIVQIGDSFVASMTTKEWTKIKLMKLIQSELPGFLKPIMPYSLFINRFNSDWHVSGILHESFHAFQAQHNFDRLQEAENSNIYHSQYPWDNLEVRELWLQERQLLAKALIIKEEQKLKNKVQEWINLRSQRHFLLDSTSIAYEKQREWLEGTAKYVELKSWEVASNAPNYTPLPEMRNDSDFDFYSKAESQIKNEVRQLQSDLQFSETIFYYSGWAQAELLDQLYPGWKSKAFEDGVYLDDLLFEACIPISCPVVTP